MITITLLTLLYKQVFWFKNESESQIMYCMYRMSMHEQYCHICICRCSNLWKMRVKLKDYQYNTNHFLFRYMCKLSDKDLRMAGNRNMTELMWAAVKEPLETHFQFDKEGLDLAFKYFTCSTLTIRLAGIAQINVRRISIGPNTCILIFKKPLYFHRKYFAC